MRRQQLLAAADCLEGVLSQLGQLPQQVCHADANEANILVDAARAKVG
jgi:Ser/Thr protein kinase RdoA (MazF antagonist)